MNVVKFTCCLYIALSIIIVILSVLQIVNINLTKHYGKLQLANAKFKIGQTVYVCSKTLELFKGKVTGILIRKKDLVYEIDEGLLWDEKYLHTEYSSIKQVAINELDKAFKKL